MITLNLKDGEELAAVWCPPDVDGSMVGATLEEGKGGWSAQSIVVGHMPGPMGRYAVALVTRLDGSQDVIPLHMAETFTLKFSFGGGLVMPADQKWNPTEEQIAKTIEAAKGEPRLLAIGYLRATRRARQAEASFKILADLSEAQTAAFMGDVAGTKAGVKKAARDARAAKQAFEEDKGR